MFNYKECSHCGKITDDDENKCPSCGLNPFLEESISRENLVSKINSREILLRDVWTKRPNALNLQEQSLPLKR